MEALIAMGDVEPFIIVLPQEAPTEPPQISKFPDIMVGELIPQIAKELDIKTLVGAWLGTDKDKNQQEIENLIQLTKDGFVDIAAVGNEVLYRNDLPKNELLDVIRHVKKEIPNIRI